MSSFSNKKPFRFGNVLLLLFMVPPPLLSLWHFYKCDVFFFHFNPHSAHRMKKPFSCTKIIKELTTTWNGPLVSIYVLNINIISSSSSNVHVWFVKLLSIFFQFISFFAVSLSLCVSGGGGGGTACVVAIKKFVD